MTAGELIEVLQRYPAATPLITSMCSDYCDVTEPSETLATKDKGGWRMRHHATAPDEFLTCLYFEGN